MLSRLTFSTKGIGDKSQVFFQSIAAVNRFDKPHKATDHIIVKVFVIADEEGFE